MVENRLNHWVNIDPDLKFDEPALGELLAYWQGKRRGRPMPARGDIDPLDLPGHMGHLCLIDVELAPRRLRYRLLGSVVTEALGRDMTGRYFDEIYADDALADANRALEWIIEQRAPLRSHGRVLYKDKSHYRYETLNLPLSEDGETVNMIFGELRLSLPDRA